jgi:hypothetical protein
VRLSFLRLLHNQVWFPSLFEGVRCAKIRGQSHVFRRACMLDLVLLQEGCKRKTLRDLLRGAAGRRSASKVEVIIPEGVLQGKRQVLWMKDGCTEVLAQAAEHYTKSHGCLVESRIIIV